MKKLVFAGVILALVSVLAIWGNNIAGRTLDAQLAPLLTRELGLPVELTPIRAQLLQLKASSDQLLMGQADDPAVVAKQVEVSISLEALLQGEIRLASAQAEDLMVKVEAWPKTGGPLPPDYHFLDQWLPTNLAVSSGRYVDAADQPYPLQALRWQRQTNGSATISWQEQRGNGVIQIDNKLQSLYTLLDMQPISVASVLTLPTMDGDDVADKVSIDWQVEPTADAAYQITASVSGSGVEGRTVVTGSDTWTLPDSSNTTIDELQPDAAANLLSAFSRETADDNGEWIDDPLPRLDLPTHRGQVFVDVLRLGDEVGKDSSFDFTSDGEGLKITNVESRGPTGLLNADLQLLQKDNNWSVNVDATMTVIDEDSGLAEQFVNADWFWETGQAKLTGEGPTWSKLLNSLEGRLELNGHHQDTVHTPVAITANLDSTPGVFGLDDISLTLGDGYFRGSASLSNDRPRKLVIDAEGEGLDLTFLFEDGEDLAAPGIAMPEFLGILPNIDIDASLAVTDLSAPGLRLATASGELRRNQSGGTFTAKLVGVESGTIDIALSGDIYPDKDDEIFLKTKLIRVDLPAMFKQEGLLHSRTSGTLEFSGSGEEIPEIFESMRGSATMELDIRPDNNWQRSAKDIETLSFRSDARMVIDGKQITGVDMNRLEITSLEQDVTGDLSLVDGRSPWLIAKLRSRRLDITGLTELLPESTEEADRMDFLQGLRQLGAAKMSLDVDSLIIEDTPLSQAYVKVESAVDLLDVKQLDFTTFGSKLTSRGKFTWQGATATMSAEAKLENVNIDQFLLLDPDMEQVPVSGTAKISSTGDKVAELVANATGHIELAASNQPPNPPIENRRRFSLVAQRMPDGVKTNIRTLQWGESELSGELVYHHTSPPRLEVSVDAGTLSLLPWENALTEDAESAKKKGEHQIDETARRSRNVVGRALRAPLRFLGADRSSASDERFFSTEPMDFSALKNLDVSFKGSLDTLKSSVLRADQVSFDGELRGGKLDLKLASGAMNGGSGDIDLQLDPSATPTTLALTSNFTNVRGLSGVDTYPRSGFASLDSFGQSQADLAANAKGLFFLELGEGPFDYANTTIITGDLATAIFQRLIPGIENEQQRVECGITVGLVKDGVAMTPYGFAIRTNQANLLGRLQVNLRNEEVQMTFDSRSRRGVGLSVGNVFSNTVQVVGTISDPRIAPRTTGLAWRGWAAFMTAGLSVVGESVLKRVLASENPCESTHKLIEKELCPNSELAASSEMICPRGGSQPNDDPFFWD